MGFWRFAKTNECDETETRNLMEPTRQGVHGHQLDTLAKEADAAEQSEIEVMKSKFKTDNLSEDDLADLRAYLGIE